MVKCCEMNFFVSFLQTYSRFGEIFECFYPKIWSVSRYSLAKFLALISHSNSGPLEGPSAAKSRKFSDQRASDDESMGP